MSVPRRTADGVVDKAPALERERAHAREERRGVRELREERARAVGRAARDAHV
jgi:hypothetical protein